MILIAEDNATMRLGMVESLRREKYTVHGFPTGPELLAFLKEHETQLVVTDLRMEPMDGLALLEQVKSLSPATEVILVSAYGTVQDAVQAMHNGAADFLTKPFSPDELRIRVAKTLEKQEQRRRLLRLSEQNRFLSQELSAPFSTIIGNAPAMQPVFELIDRVARENSSVLISGESGTGKELVARAIHRRSARNAQPFVRVNCAALNDNLLESELFGHEKGAFTGAIRQKKGRFELAEGGTLFLDEIGDISPALQVKLLRVLQEKEFERVGGEQTLRADVRIIAATNKNLSELIRSGQFREDLYYRLNVIPIHLPPLRERKEDIPLLADHFLTKLNSRKHFSSEGMAMLHTYSWPGNIRELENLTERLHVISKEDEIPAALVARFLNADAPVSAGLEHLPLEQALYHFEKQLLTEAMKQAGGVKARAARALGIGASALYYKLEKFGLLK